MCIRCHEAEATEPDGYCRTCQVQARIEFSRGMRRLSQYLAAWAAFEDWLRKRRLDASPV